MSAEALVLPPAALPAWQAYRRLLDTKAAHFAALEAGERAADGGAKLGLARQAQLAALLDAHTAAVTVFREAMLALAASDPLARDALVATLVRVNEGLIPGDAPGGH